MHRTRNFASEFAPRLHAAVQTDIRAHTSARASKFWQPIGARVDTRPIAVSYKLRPQRHISAGCGGRELRTTASSQDKAATLHFNVQDFAMHNFPQE